MKRRIVLTLMALALLGTAACTQGKPSATPQTATAAPTAAAAAVAPQISLTPTQLRIGESARVFGNGFPAGAVVLAGQEISPDGSFGSFSFSVGEIAVAEQDGSFSTTVPFGEILAPGRYLIQAVDAGGHTTRMVELSVKP